MTTTLEQFQSIGRRIASWRRPLLLTHGRADGDAIGSLLTMRAIFRSLGADPQAVLFEPPSDKYVWIDRDDPICVLRWKPPSVESAPPGDAGTGNGRIVELDNIFSCDGILIMDTCAYTQLTPVAERLRAARRAGNPPIVVVDHHVTRDDVADEYMVDESASATCLILHDWARACEWRVDDAARLAMFVGIATDTGWFRFSNTDQRTLRAAAELVGSGVCPNDIYDRLFESESVARVRLFGAAVNGMELHDDDRVAILTVTRSMFETLGAVPADTEDLVNQALRIHTVETAALVADLGGKPQHVIKISFRSKATVDVAALAGQFGGGGHQRAAGARRYGRLDDVKRDVLAALRAAASRPRVD
ncbi:MAG: hypothetical protein HOP29_18065 [Phycisphaerales bacterium]|nr:hypothetical protein [Phycisphaerales bacterium]